MDNLIANPRNNRTMTEYDPTYTLTLSYRYKGSGHVWTMRFRNPADLEAYKNIFAPFVEFV